MELTVLVAKLNAGGETYTEALAVVDDGIMDENPDWWPQEVERQLASRSPEIVRHAFLRIEVPDDALRRALDDTFEVEANVEVAGR